MQGTLSDFTLAEILQLVAVQTKTGLLRVQSRDRLLTLYFDNGVLVSCRDRRHVANDPLLHFLKSTGYLTADEAAELEAQSSNRRTDVADLLIDRSFIDSNELEIALEDTAQDLIHRTFNWREGTYRFITGPEALEGLSHRISCKVESLLMEAARRADEWSNLTAELPTPELTLGGLKSVPTGLDPKTHDLLRRLRVPTKLADLVGKARMSEFEVYETLVGALHEKWIKIVELPEAETKPKARSFRNTGTVREIHARRDVDLSSVLLWMFSLIVFVSSVVGGAWKGWEYFQRAESQESQTLGMEVSRAQVRRALDVYRAIHGSYPVDLEALRASSLVESRLLEEANIDSYARRPGGKRYRLIFSSS